MNSKSGIDWGVLIALPLLLAAFYFQVRECVTCIWNRGTPGLWRGHVVQGTRKSEGPTVLWALLLECGLGKSHCHGGDKFKMELEQPLNIFTSWNCSHRILHFILIRKAEKGKAVGQSWPGDAWGDVLVSEAHQLQPSFAPPQGDTRKPWGFRVEFAKRKLSEMERCLCLLWNSVNDCEQSNSSQVFIKLCFLWNNNYRRNMSVYLGIKKCNWYRSVQSKNVTRPFILYSLYTPSKSPSQALLGVCFKASQDVYFCIYIYIIYII